MSNALMKLIEDYAGWSAQSYWQDDQGYTDYVEIARANMETARKAVVDAVATLQAENERLKATEEYQAETYRIQQEINSELQSRLDAMGKGEAVAYDDKSCADMLPRRVMQRAHAFCPTEFPHVDRMAWMADYFVRNAAPKALEPLTDEQVLEVFGKTRKVPSSYVGWIADQRILWGRAIEAAHGIHAAKGGPQ